ncbi:MAG TPA: hypothetical protein VEX42_00435 [Microbacterium sp.]|nr:hypothetical protein [Microbacterium sp.]
MLTHNTPIHLHSLSFLPDRGEVVIGRTDIDSYAVFPEDGAALVRELQAGRTPAQAADWYAGRYGERVDMGEFLGTLDELEFLADGPLAAGAAPVRWQRLGRAMFSAPAWFAYVALIAAAVALCVTHPSFAPRSEHVFFSDYLTVVTLSVFAGQLVLTLVHEFFHVLAARRIGVGCRVRIARRFYFVVFETVLDGLVVVPRAKRYLPILAGMLCDVLAIAGLTVLAYLVPPLAGICLALAFTTIPRLVWQFYFHLRTDVYALLTTALGTVDLDTVTRGVLRNRFHRLVRRPGHLVDEKAWHPRDRQVARWYAPLHLVGYAASLVMLLVVIAPLAWRFFSDAATQIASGSGTAQFWDSALVMTMTFGQLAFAALLAWRERQPRPRTT